MLIFKKHPSEWISLAKTFRRKEILKNELEKNKRYCIKYFKELVAIRINSNMYRELLIKQESIFSFLIIASVLREINTKVLIGKKNL